jgi:hypothetical protein
VDVPDRACSGEPPPEVRGVALAVVADERGDRALPVGGPEREDEVRPDVELRVDDVEGLVD